MIDDTLFLNHKLSMKRLLFLFTMLLLSGAVVAQNTGIGTPSPDYTLDVNGTLGINDTIYHNDDPDTWMAFPAPDTWELVVGGKQSARVDAINSTFTVNPNQDDIDFLIRSYGINPLLYADTQNEHIGIGTDTPQELVDIDNGNMLIRGDGINALMFADHNNDKLGIGTATPEHLVDIDGGNMLIRGDGINALLFVDYANDRVGIGTDNPQAALHVEGLVVTDSIKVGDSRSIGNMQFGQKTFTGFVNGLATAVQINYSGFTGNPMIFVSVSNPTNTIEPLAFNVRNVTSTSAEIQVEGINGSMNGDIVITWMAIE